MEKKRRMLRAVESGRFVGNGRKSRILRESRNGGKPPLLGEPDIPGGRGQLRKSLIYKYICRKMIYFAIKWHKTFFLYRMKDITVGIKLELYLKEWLETAMGRPVRFPSKSYENALLHRFLVRGGQNRMVDDNVLLVITDCHYRKPETYNCLGRDGRRAMAAAIDALFRIDLWSGCAGLVTGKGNLNNGIEEWCRRKGISAGNREAVRQKFYRMRKAYQERGIIIGKIYGKSVR